MNVFQKEREREIEKSVWLGENEITFEVGGNVVGFCDGCPCRCPRREDAKTIREDRHRDFRARWWERNLLCGWKLRGKGAKIEVQRELRHV